MILTNSDKQAMARKAATFYGIDPALVCAICEQESDWNHYAVRYEPAFFAKYVAPLYTNNKISATEAYTRSFSWGLMQLMGQVARELGFSNGSLAGLIDPGTNLDWGCMHFAKKLTQASGDTHKALFLWNGGGNPLYPDQVIARVSKYNVEILSNREAVQMAATGEQ